ncbi:hypothetical protein [Prochlorococcus sp. MIT 1307]|uniref:hypothetical protein n=1 Tax=Prochlorococcus sp. MIT 1307 TaxID=3096219 RepID=UPI002A766AC9|nr:hypothetical protein [Prochlorococcus sp. MIT 1307]
MRILIFFFWILTGIATGVVASDKGHGFGSWLFAGLLLGPLGLIAVAGLSDQKLREYIRRTMEPPSIRTNQNTQKLLEEINLKVDSTPKLLSESQSNFDEQNQGYLKDKYIGDFLLNKRATKDQIWRKIFEMLEFHRPDIATLSDPVKSNLNLSLTGGRAYIICRSDGAKIALAYTKDSPDNHYLYWQLRIY